MSDSGAAIDPARRYHYVFDRGPRSRRTSRASRDRACRWSAARRCWHWRRDAFPDAEIAAEAKRLMREVLDHYLEQRHIVSRRVVRDLQALDEGKDAA